MSPSNKPRTTVFSAGTISGILRMFVQCLHGHCVLSFCDALAGLISLRQHSVVAAKCPLDSFVMAALRSRCGHYIFVLWFLSSFFYFFSSPNLSRRRLDVCHTSTYDVALVRIQDACLKCTACGSVKMQHAKKYAKNHHLRAIAQRCWAIS